LKRRGGALKGALHAERHANFLLGFVDGLGGFAKRRTGCQIERDGDDGKLPLVIDGQGAALHFEAGKALRGTAPPFTVATG